MATLRNPFFILCASAAALCFTGNASGQTHASIGKQNYQAENSADQVNEPGTVMFTPPSGWRFADSNSLPPSVKTMVVGKGQHEFPPSMNLGTEAYKGTLKQYLKVIKGINDSQGSEWKDLGTVRTEAGDASLSQVDSKTQWGDVRMMHVILIRNGIVYILTSAALKEEFPKFYKEFFNSMRSLRINNDEPTALIHKDK